MNDYRPTRRGTPRPSPTLLCFALVAALLGMNACRPQPSPTAPVAASRPDVVLIVIDTLRADRVEAQRNGIPVMPKLSRFARENWSYPDALSAASWTKPSMASIFLSLYPDVHGVQWGVDGQLAEAEGLEADRISESAVTWPEWLKEAGYSTAAVQSNANLKPEFGFAQGFDSYDLRIYPGSRGADVTDTAIARLQELHGPYFLYVHYMDPHFPYGPPKPHDEAFGPPPQISEQDRALLDSYEDYYFDKIMHDLGVRESRQLEEVSEAGREYVRYMYDAEARYVDEQVARLIEAVTRRSPDALVIVTADHGEEFWEHGSVGHGKTLYQELIHVPLIIRAPWPSARVRPEPVETIDLLPTVASLLGLPANPDWQGRAIDTVGDDDTPRLRFSQTRAAIPAAGVNLSAVVDGPLKLIADRRGNVSTLFNTGKDPKELNPETNPAETSRLESALATHSETCARHPLEKKVVEKTGIDAQTREQLQGVGYLQK